MKYKEGDIVKIISNQHGHEFNIGEKIRIKEVGDTNYKAEYLDGHDYWFVEEDEIELVKKEDKEFLERFILCKPFDFKQGIINHCRQMDKIDVYAWVAEDELKIQQLQQRIDKAKNYIEENMKLDENSLIYVYEFDERKELLEILKGGNNE